MATRDFESRFGNELNREPPVSEMPGCGIWQRFTFLFFIFPSVEPLRRRVRSFSEGQSRNVVSVYLREEVRPTNKLFIMSGDTFNKMVDLSREFEQSLLKENTDDREDRLNCSHPKYTYPTKKMTIAIKRSNISSLEKCETELVEPIDIKVFLSI